ncbi:hypothetical protein [Parasphingorhabdus flavimaris]|uniref:hypothetical protein n=1 Tax=Parasphingorhabdus flavimaris TaxID=266812 RepID=UPI0030026097
MSEYKFRKFVEAYAKERSINDIVNATGLSSNSIARKIKKLRSHIVRVSLKHRFTFFADRLSPLQIESDDLHLEIFDSFNSNERVKFIKLLATLDDCSPFTDQSEFEHPPPISIFIREVKDRYYQKYGNDTRAFEKFGIFTDEMNELFLKACKAGHKYKDYDSFPEYYHESKIKFLMDFPPLSGSNERTYETVIEGYVESLSEKNLVILLRHWLNLIPIFKEVIEDEASRFARDEADESIEATGPEHLIAIDTGPAGDPKRKLCKDIADDLWRLLLEMRFSIIDKAMKNGTRFRRKHDGDNFVTTKIEDLESIAELKKWFMPEQLYHYPMENIDDYDHLNDFKGEIQSIMRKFEGTKLDSNTYYAKLTLFLFEEKLLIVDDVCQILESGRRFESFEDRFGEHYNQRMRETRHRKLKDRDRAQLYYHRIMSLLSKHPL